MKQFNGKALYNPSGKAGEYSYWACNFYVGCSNGCTYCYCKKGVLKGTMGGDKPTLKKCFKDEDHAMEVFEKELKSNLHELQKHGIFFSFTTDPMLHETIAITIRASILCRNNNVPVKTLTKRVEWIDEFLDAYIGKDENIAFGLSITGHDELEPGASANWERIKGMRKLHDAGFKTFASIEPIIDFERSLDVISTLCNFQCCDLLKVGLESGKKYDKQSLIKFIEKVIWLCESGHDMPNLIPVYFKDSLLKAAGIDRASLPANCVTRDYNIFNQ